MPRFAANLTLLFTEHAFLDRFEAASRAGFTAVEFLFPYEHSPDDIAGRLAANGLDLVLFNMPAGGLGNRRPRARRLAGTVRRDAGWGRDSARLRARPRAAPACT